MSLRTSRALEMILMLTCVCRIIQDARARNPSLPPLREPLPCGLTDEEEDPNDTQPHDEDSGKIGDRKSWPKLDSKSLNHPRCASSNNELIGIEWIGLRPWRKLRKFCRKIQRSLRLPFLPVWP